MLHNIMSFLHISPLLAILVMLLTARSSNIAASKLYAIVVALSGLGIAAGSFMHASHVHMVDPCLFYAGALLYSAFGILRHCATPVKAKLKA